MHLIARGHECQAYQQPGQQEGDAMNNPKCDPPAKGVDEQGGRKIHVERKRFSQPEADRQRERKAHRAPTKDLLLLFAKP